MKLFILQIRKRMLQKKESAKNHGESIIIMDIPLLFESKLTEVSGSNITRFCR